jgi:hypothetical protein
MALDAFTTNKADITRANIDVVLMAANRYLAEVSSVRQWCLFGI